MIEMRRKQLSFGDGLIAEEVSDLRENWMPHGRHHRRAAGCAEARKVLSGSATCRRVSPLWPF
jgi:hypothetical protein